MGQGVRFRVPGGTHGGSATANLGQASSIKRRTAKKGLALTDLENSEAMAEHQGGRQLPTLSPSTFPSPLRPGFRCLRTALERRSKTRLRRKPGCSGPGDRASARHALSRPAPCLWEPAAGAQRSAGAACRSGALAERCTGLTSARKRSWQRGRTGRCKEKEARRRRQGGQRLFLRSHQAGPSFTRPHTCRGWKRRKGRACAGVAASPSGVGVVPQASGRSQPCLAQVGAFPFLQD